MELGSRPDASAKDGATPEQIEALNKYSIDGPFLEPVVRCDSCQELLIVKDMRKVGMCPHCSNTRVRNVRTMNEQDMEKAKAWASEGKIDPVWLHIFGVVQ